ncbi:MAG: hypothetical protein EXR71_01485 [Myxococcales bacterium]|nr:hypothetical protein [Myxococcales bacterium]
MIRLVLTALLVACESSKEEAPGFQGGGFEVTVNNATDMCLSGGFEDALLPDDGLETFEVPMELPGVADLPWTTTIDMLDPLGQAQVTFETGEQGEDFMQAMGGVLPTVEYDPVVAPGCFVEVTVDLYLKIVDENAAAGSAVLHLASFDEAACPEPGAEICDARLDLRWDRL